MEDKDVKTRQKEAADLLRRWDAGEPIWSVEMGGMGPGYEQAIQVLAVEILRDEITNPLPTEANYRNWGDATITRIDYQLPNGKWSMGFSRAQVGAAKTIAFRWLRDGVSGFQKSIPEDRKIQVSKFFPKAPEAPK